MPRERRNEERIERLKARNQEIREYYFKEWNRGFRTAKIINDMTKKYHLDSTTLEQIVFNRGTYAKM